MSLFPILRTETSDSSQAVLPLATEPKWDFELDRPVFAGGEPVMATGLEAVRTWAWNALLTERGKWPSLARSYGNDCHRLIGTPYSDELKEAEARRYITECLLTSPYITDVEVAELSFDEATLVVRATIKTIYGEADISV